MKKRIILATEGKRFSSVALRYAIQIAKATDSMLVGVFLRDFSMVGLNNPVIFEQPYLDLTAYTEMKKDERKKIETNLSLFDDRCNKAGVNHSMIVESNNPIESLLYESAFADLIILDSKTNYDSLFPGEISSSLKDVLSESHCPVMVVPMSYIPVERIILLYDGSFSSTYAIKMFSYVFSEWNELPVTLLSVNAGHSNHLKENKNIRSLVERHFKQIKYEVLNGDARNLLTKHLRSQGKNSLVVMGAFGRTAISRLFRQSQANSIISEVQLPIFITHQ